MRDTQKAKPMPGPLVLTGGAEVRTGVSRVLREFVHLAGGARSRLVVVTVASEFPAEVGRDYLTTFHRLGGKDVTQLDILDRAPATATVTAARPGVATGVVFTGGNQLRIANLLGGTPVDAAPHRRRAEGLVVGGTSAGAAMMSGTMIVAGPTSLRPGTGRSRSGRGWICSAG